MAETTRESETFQIGAPIRAGGIRMLLIERTVARVSRAGRGVWCWSDKVPHVLVLFGGGRIRAMDVNAVPVSLDRLRDEVHGLDAMLASL